MKCSGQAGSWRSAMTGSVRSRPPSAGTPPGRHRHRNRRAKACGRRLWGGVAGLPSRAAHGQFDIETRLLRAAAPTERAAGEQLRARGTALVRLEQMPTAPGSWRLTGVPVQGADCENGGQLESARLRLSSLANGQRDLPAVCAGTHNPADYVSKHKVAR
jgi:hypothetical protein